jgi:hypothetical protein
MMREASSSRFTFHVLRFTLAHRPALLSLLAVTVIYLAALISLPSDALTHHDTGAKYLQVRNLRLAPNGLDWSINYPARPFDSAVQFAPFHPKQHTVDEQERIYLQWPIFLGLLTRIPWKLMGFWGLYLVPLLAGLGTAWAAYRLAFAVGVPRNVAWLAVPLVGLTTPVFVYSLLYFEHTLAALLVTASLLMSVRAMAGGADVGATRRVAPTATALSAALLAAAIYFRSELYILALVILGAHVLQALKDKNWRVPSLWLGTFIASLVPLWAFYAIKEGNILPLHATWYFAGSSGGESAPATGLELPRLRYIAAAGWRVIPDFLFGPQTFPLSPRYPFWVEAVGLLGVALCIVAALGRVLRLPISLRLGTLTAGLACALLPSLVTLLSPDPYYNLHGFLTATPFILLALWPPYTPENSTQHSNIPHSALRIPQWLYAVTLTYVALHVLVISALSGLGPISRHEWGQRYLLPAYPALIVLALLAAYQLWSAYRPQLQRLALPALTLVSLMALVGVGLEARGTWMLWEERTQVESWLNLARTLPPREPLVTDVWWLPLNLAADFYTRPMMLAEGDTRLTEWAAQMRQRNVPSFSLMTNNPQVLASSWLPASGYHPNGPPQQSRGMYLQRYTLPSNP